MLTIRLPRFIDRWFIKKFFNIDDLDERAKTTGNTVRRSHRQNFLGADFSASIEVDPPKKEKDKT